MMEAVKVALAELGVPPENIRTEAFGPARGQVPAPSPAAAATPAEGTIAQLTFEKSGKSVASPPDRTVLEAAEEAGVAIDYACRVGTCGICAVKLLRGTVEMAVEDGLPPEDKARGMILACQAKATSDIVVEA